MKRWYILGSLAVVLIIAFAVMAMAQMPPAAPVTEEMMMEEEMPSPPGRGAERWGQSAMAIMGSHIYVVFGGSLLKYDGELNLVDQVELPSSEWEAGEGAGRHGRGRGGGRGMGRGPGMMPPM